MNRLSRFVIVAALSAAVFASPAPALDRITMDYGDIFLGTIEDTINYRYHVKRNGYLTALPAWWVKKIEPDVDALLSDEELARFPPRGMNTISGYEVNVTSNSPTETSHLELYPKRSHFWMQARRYLRGYFINQSDTAFKRIRIRLSYFGTDGKKKYQHETEVHEYYPKTMKPFIVDARFVPWREIARLDVRIVEAIEMKPPPAG